jgi:hypothetical protein
MDADFYSEIEKGTLNVRLGVAENFWGMMEDRTELQQCKANIRTYDGPSETDETVAVRGRELYDRYAPITTGA